MLGSERPWRARALAIAGAATSARGSAAFGGISGTSGLVYRHELVFAVADEIGTSHPA